MHTVSALAEMLLVFLGVASGGVCGYCFARATAAEAVNPEVCQCTHGAAFHDGSGCRERVVVRDPLTLLSRNAKCSCAHYVGPSTSYVPELDGPDGPLNGGRT